MFILLHSACVSGDWSPSPHSQRSCSLSCPVAILQFSSLTLTWASAMAAFTAATSFSSPCGFSSRLFRSQLVRHWCSLYL